MHSPCTKFKRYKNISSENRGPVQIHRHLVFFLNLSAVFYFLSSWSSSVWGLTAWAETSPPRARWFLEIRDSQRLTFHAHTGQSRPHTRKHPLYQATMHHLRARHQAPRDSPALQSPLKYFWPVLSLLSCFAWAFLWEAQGRLLSMLSPCSLCLLTVLVQPPVPHAGWHGMPFLLGIVSYKLFLVAIVSWSVSVTTPE